MSNDRPPEALRSDFAVVARMALAGGQQESAPKILLHIGDEQLVVLSGQGERAATEQRLGLGVLSIASELFHHDPPTALEIEQAIDVVEDQLVLLGPRASPGTTLWSMSEALRTWSAVSGPAMMIETVEQWFQRLALAAHGQVDALRGLPSGREAAATLLVLREFMYHRGHVSIVVVDPRKALVDLPASA
jgi:hypothetical protein